MAKRATPVSTPPAAVAATSVPVAARKAIEKVVADKSAANKVETGKAAAVKPEIAKVPMPAKPQRAEPDAAPVAKDASLTLADVKLISARLKALNPAEPPPAADGDAADRIVALVVEKLAVARAADTDRIGRLESALDSARLAAGKGVALDDLRDALETTDTLVGELRKAQAANAVLASEIAEMKKALIRAEQDVAQLRKTQQPARDGLRVLGAESIASLLSEFMASFSDRLGPLQLNGGEILLKAGFASVGGTAVFVLPSATEPPSNLEHLHEIRLRLDPGKALA